MFEETESDDRSALRSHRAVRTDTPGVGFDARALVGIRPEGCFVANNVQRSYRTPWTGLYSEWWDSVDCFYRRPAVSRPSKVMSKALS
ncbi:hypothetical protein AB0M87_32925, partial [Streptomyces sp. NPDC051320]|uniref:hypothetical protein n=1 Tax=Streptomyces sp. NPDC051320 TaxID=3154644 RepID=UPI003421379A